MIRINLLPHREERRKRERTYFAILAGVTAAIGLAVVGVVHVFNANRISVQTERNVFLKGELAKLDKEIDEIKRLREEIASLLARKQVIESLQAERAQTVRLLDQLVRQMPEGVYVSKVSQKGSRVSLIGYAQSNARVSTLMRNIESSQWLEKPVLVEIKAGTVSKKRVSEFNLNLAMKSPAQPSAEKDAGKAPAKPAAAKKG